MRLGWAVIQIELQENFLILSQNLFISSGSLSLKAAVKVFDCIEDLNKNVKIYEQNRNITFDYLNNTPWSRYSKTEGGFYTYIDVADFTNNSSEMVKRILQETFVGLTPGADFDKQYGSKFIRLSFSCETEALKTGMQRLTDWINKNY